MAILQAYSGGLRLPGQQPRGASQIDWSHPLTRGLSLVQLCQNASTINIPLFIDNGSIGSLATLGTIGVAPAGIGFSSGVWSVTNTNYNAPITAGTCVSYQTVGSWGPTDSLDHQGFLLNSFHHIRKFADNNWYVGWVGPDTRAVVAAAGTFSQGDTFSAATTWSASGTRFYTKGIFRGSNATATSSAATAGGTFNINPSNFVVTAGKDAIYYALLWSRVLGDDEIALLAADPYCFLIPAEGEMPSLSSPGIAPTTYIAFSVIQ